MTQAIGSERVGLRLSPLSYNSMKDSDPLASSVSWPTSSTPSGWLTCVMRADFFGVQRPMSCP